MAASIGKINVRTFLSQWDNNVFQYCAEDFKSDADTLGEKMGMSVDNVKELENVCRTVKTSPVTLVLIVPSRSSTHNMPKRLDKLESDPEGCSQFDKWSNLENIPLDAKLVCLNFQKQELERRKKSIHYYSAVLRKMKYTRTDDQLTFNAMNSKLHGRSIPEDNKVVYPDVVLTVNVHRPVRARQGPLYEDHVRLSAYMSNTWLVLGRQKLTDLRDIIRCVNDLTVPGEMSENVDSETQPYCKDVFKSGFFFIDDTFYNDLREDDARDYSIEIQQWASTHNIGPYKKQKMEDSTFLDLTLELGKPYLYMHQGDCQHILVFSDIKLLTTDDPQDVTMYPLMTRRCARRRTVCRLCNHSTVRWIIYNSEFTPENPSFLCDFCFRSLHYDTENKKMGQFEAYRYFDHHAIV